MLVMSFGHLSQGEVGTKHEVFWEAPVAAPYTHGGQAGVLTWDGWLGDELRNAPLLETNSQMQLVGTQIFVLAWT